MYANNSCPIDVDPSPQDSVNTFPTIQNTGKNTGSLSHKIIKPSI